MTNDTSTSARSSTSHVAAEVVPNKPPEPALPQGWFKRTVFLVKQTVSDWSDDEASRLAASLAFYTLLSLAPLLMLSIAVAGWFMGSDAASGEIARELEGVVGPAAGQAIEEVIRSGASNDRLGSIIGVGVALFGASGVFGELQVSMNRVWEVQPKPQNAILEFLRARFFSMTMVMGVAFLLLVSLAVSAALAAVLARFNEMVPLPGLWMVLNFLIALLLVSLLFALIFKLVPDVKVGWRDVWVGALVTGTLFSIGKMALAAYLGTSEAVTAFGAAGSLVALIVWVYYSAQIMFFGAEFTQVYARYFGSRITPNEHAVRVRGRQSRARAQEPVPSSSH